MTDEEKIRARAFEIFEYRQEYKVDGNALNDWLKAEKEIYQESYTPEDEA